MYGNTYRDMLRKTKEREGLEKEKGVRGNKGNKGIRDTLREIDERISKNKSID
jgi:hypothetical protein